MLTKRPCTKEDRGFVYDLLKENLGEYFDRNTKEGWSDEKFDKGFDPDRITILEIDKKPVGFYDVEKIDDKKPFLYVHNVQLVKEERGHPFTLIKLIDDEARARGLKFIKAKVFKDNYRTLRFLALFKYSIIYYQNLEEQENSVYVLKELL